MTSRFTHPVTYSCDRCPAQAVGELGKLPEGWTEQYRLQLASVDGPIEHLCPACSRPAIIP